MKFVDVYTCGGLSVWNIQCRGLMGVDVNDNVKLSSFFSHLICFLDLI